MYKVCVYAICRNEIDNVDAWLDSMSEADYVVVLDSGSTDGTFEKLKADPRVTKCRQKVIDPWRFDKGRNESLKLVPKDSDILFCTDLDERLEPGWADILRNAWSDEYTRGFYKYTWKHNESGEDETTFWYDKIHTLDYKWKYPVHEQLYTKKEEKKIYIDGIHLHHYPNGESRPTYLPLLELRVEENPKDFYSKFYLAREYGFYKMYEKGIELFKEIADSDSKEKNDGLMLPGCYCFIGDYYRELGDKDEAIKYYLKSIESNRTYREPYLYIAEIFNEKQMYSLAIHFIEEAFDNSVRHYNWLERDSTWREKPYDILCIAYYYLNDYNRAYSCALTAYEFNKTNNRLYDNLMLCKNRLN